jgi:hypothetical protein
MIQRKGRADYVCLDPEPADEDIQMEYSSY